jgi:hypothetical protein
MTTSDCTSVLNTIRNHRLFPLGIVIIILTIGYFIVMHFHEQKQAANNAIVILQLMQMGKPEMPDERKIREMIELPNRNPEWLTSSMVVPSNLPSDEKRKETRMEILNMFYNNGIDDQTSIHARPQNLYVIP